MADFEFTDRYQALGIPYPDPNTVCLGQCEGTGVVPIAKDDEDPVFLALWEAAERANPADDGWHFVKCPDCGGTGKQPTTRRRNQPWLTVTSKRHGASSITTA